MQRSAAGAGRQLRVLHVIWWGELGGIALNLVDLARHARTADHAMTVCVLTHSSPLIDALADQHVRVTEIGARSGRDVRALIRFTRFLRRERFDVVHDHSGTFLAALGIRLGAAGARTIHQEHGGINVPRLRTRKRSYYRLFGRRYDRFIAISDLTAADMRHAGVAPDRIVTITNPVDPARFSADRPREEAKHALGIPHTALTVGTACRFVKEKDLPLFLAVARIIHGIHPEVLFVLVGAGPEEESLRREVDEYGLAQVVRFPGIRTDMPAVWRAFDVYLFTSRVEPFGRTLLESQACETPVVAAVPQVGGAIDLVRTSPGIVSRGDRDPAHLARLTLELLESAALRAATGQAGRRWVSARYHIADWIRRLDAVYRGSPQAHVGAPTAVRNRDTIEDIDATR